jgi:hypothetical protein
MRTADSIVCTMCVNQVMLQSSHMPSEQKWTVIKTAMMTLMYYSRDRPLLELSSASEAGDEELRRVERNPNQPEITMRFCHQPIYSMPSCHVPTLDLFSLDEGFEMELSIIAGDRRRMRWN